MTDAAKADLASYLQRGREDLLWKLDGASEFDARRPLTPTGTNLLGLVKHVASVESGSLGDVFGPPSRAPPPPAPSASRCRGWTTTPSPTPTCGRPPRRAASRSSPSTTGCGRTPT